MTMKLLDRYLQAVKTSLPKEQRDDIARSCRTTSCRRWRTRKPSSAGR